MEELQYTDTVERPIGSCNQRQCFDSHEKKKVYKAAFFLMKKRRFITYSMEKLVKANKVDKLKQHSVTFLSKLCELQ